MYEKTAQTRRGVTVCARLQTNDKRNTKRQRKDDEIYFVGVDTSKVACIFFVRLYINFISLRVLIYGRTQ